MKGHWEARWDVAARLPAPTAPPGIAWEGTSVCPPRQVHALTSEPDGKATASASLAHFTGP